MDDFLNVSDIISGYGKQEILHGISIRVDKGEVVTVVGPNGCGKSTFLNTVMRFLPAWKGSIRFRGTDLTPLTPDQAVRHGVSFVPQGKVVFPDMTVAEHLDIGGCILKDRNKIREARERAYDMFPRLGERRSQLAKTMSGGEQQMLSIARALMTSPDLLVLDEPTLGLSPKLVDSMFDIILRVNRELHVAILMVEQKAALALELSNRGYVLEMGHNKYEGDSQALLRDPRVQQAYLGG